MNSRDKGKRGEREWAAELSDLLGIDARRGQQHRGGADSPDVTGLDGVHWEVKRTEALRLHEAMAQAVRDSGGESVPAVAHRRNRDGWLVTLRAEELVEFCGRVLAATEHGG